MMTMMNMRRLMADETGNMLVLSVAGLLALLGFAALAVDISCLLTAHAQLQTAADAAALAGAAQLPYGTDVAAETSIHFARRNDCLNQAVQISTADVTFPSSRRIRVQVVRRVPLHFSPLFGLNEIPLAVSATAEIGTLHGTNGLRPWGVPKFGWQVGQEVTIKAGTINAPATDPSFFYPIDFPPINRGDPETGASVYEENIRSGSRHFVYIGDILQVEPGNMVGPTAKAVEDLIAADADARWQNNRLVDSDYPGLSSPRVIKIPLYDPDVPPESGRNEITCIGLAAFFLEGISGKNVSGRFIELITNGDYGGGYSLLYGVKLVQ